MKRLSALLIALVTVSACSTPMRDAATGGLARASQQEVALGDARYLASVMPGNSGLIISKAGATAVTGMTVRVTRGGTPLGQADGKVAKAAAVAGCSQAGGRFDDRAVGRVAALGVWAFEGACA